MELSALAGFFFVLLNRSEKDPFTLFLRFRPVVGGSSMRRFHSSSGSGVDSAGSCADSSVRAGTAGSLLPAETVGSVLSAESAGSSLSSDSSGSCSSSSSSSESSFCPFSRRRSVREAKPPLIAPSAERSGLLSSGMIPSLNSSESDM